MIDAEPALAVVLHGRRGSTRRCWRSRTSSTSSRRTRSATRRRLPSSRPPRERSSVSTRPASRRSGAPDSCTTSAGSVSRTRSGTSRGPLGAGEWERVRLHPYLTERMLQQSAALAPLGAIAVAAPRAARRLGLPARPVGLRDLAPGADPRRGRRLPGDARAAALPRRALGRTRRRRSCARRSAPGVSTRRRSRRSSAPPATACPRRREGPAGADAARGRGAATAGARALEQADRASAS